MSMRIGSRWCAVGCAVLSAAFSLIKSANADDGLTLTKVPAATASAEPENSVMLDTRWWSRRVTLMPDGLLWKPPLANPQEPRSFLKIQSLEMDDLSVNDAGIGGTFPVLRVSKPETPDQGFQADVFAAVFSRFVDIRKFAAVDYRFGVPFTYSHGPWSFKVAYEHTSCHLGDEFMAEHNLESKDSTRNEVTFGIAYYPVETIRVYGVFGYWAQYSTFVDGASPQRYQCGVEWSQPGPTGVWGKPYAALDLELRGDEDFTPNVTAQVGWQWTGAHSRPGTRLALEYYDGRSPFGQFIDQHESWLALGVFVDF